MTSIILNNVTVDFPIYGSNRRSLRQTLFARTGGLIREEGDRHQRIVVRALENVSLNVDHGDRLGLVGHNGAGKTTLLKALAGIYKPLSGSIHIEGRISPLFNAAPGIDMEDTGYENILTCGMFLGMTAQQVRDKLPEIEESSELGEYLSLPVRTYSAGMLTRLGFAIATSIDPDILLLDEGLAAGDARFASRAERRMQALIDRSSALVLASHSEGLIAALCNKAALFEKGHVIAVGPTRDVLELYHQRNAASETASSPQTINQDQPPKSETEQSKLIELIYQSVHTVSALLPSDPERITPWGGSSILGYCYTRKGAEKAINLRINANAYAHEDNQVVLAVFRPEQSVPLKYEVVDVKAGEHALFDFSLRIPVDSDTVNLDVRIGPAQPGSLTVNGPTDALPNHIAPPALSIEPVNA